LSVYKHSDQGAAYRANSGPDRISGAHGNAVHRERQEQEAESKAPDQIKKRLPVAIAIHLVNSGDPNNLEASGQNEKQPAHQTFAPSSASSVSLVINFNPIMPVNNSRMSRTFAHLNGSPNT